MALTFGKIIFLGIFSIPLSCQESSHKETQNSSESQKIADLTVNLKSLAENMSPKALRVSLGSHLTAGDPCAGFNDVDPFRNFLSCQPTLLGIYMGQASMFVEEVALIMKEAKDSLIPAQDESMGSITTADGDKISYSKTDQDTFDLDVTGEGKKLATLSADGDTVNFKMDGWYIDDADEYSDEFGVYEGRVIFDGAENWSLTLFLAGLPCDARAVDSPERIKLIVNYLDNIWTGKAMTFHPRKSGDTCGNEANSSKMNVFTDFVGTIDATKASVYMMNHELDDLNKIEDFQLGKFCVNYPEICGGSIDYTTGNDPVTIPFCITKSGSTPDWGESCTDEKVSKAAYLSEKNWIIPSQFFQEDIPTL